MRQGYKKVTTRDLRPGDRILTGSNSGTLETRVVEVREVGQQLILDVEVHGTLFPPAAKTWEIIREGEPSV